MKKKVYIAGKVSGLPFLDVVEKFKKAYYEIEALGFEAVNPVPIVQQYLHDNPEYLECTEAQIWKLAMKLCIKALMDCDAIVLLPDWADSKGARFEHEIAENLDMPIFNASKGGLAVMKKNSTSWNS